MTIGIARRWTLVLLLLGTAGSGLAQPAQGSFFISPMGEPFRRADGPGEPIDRWFGGADANQDGILTLSEMERDAARFYLTLDVNRDGEIAPDEVTRYETVVAPEIQFARSDYGEYNSRSANLARQRATGEAMRAPNRGPRRRASAPGAALGLLNNPQPVTSADADFNRGVSFDEFRRAAGQRFVLLDRDHNGRIPRAELDPPPAPARR